MTGTLSLLKDAETGQRGFVITGDDAFLDPYTRAVPAVSSALAELRELAADDASLQRWIDDLEPVIVSAKLAELKRTIEQRRADRASRRRRRSCAGGAGKRDMDEIRRIAGLVDHEQREFS